MLKKTVSVITALFLLASTFCLGTTASAAEFTTFDLVLTNDGSGTVVITASVPADIGSGRLLLNVSDDLVYVADSLTSPVGGTCNDSYEVGGYSGLNVSFATSSYYNEGDIVFRAEFTVVDGSEITVDDFTADLWNLSDGVTRLASQEDGDVNKSVVNLCKVTFVADNGGSLSGEAEIVVEVGSSLSELTFPTPVYDTNYRFKSWSMTEGTVSGDMVITASFYLVGDINLDGSADNLDAAYALRYDASITELTPEGLLAGDANFDGAVDSLDAAKILKFDAGLITEF